MNRICFYLQEAAPSLVRVRDHLPRKLYISQTYPGSGWPFRQCSSGIKPITYTPGLSQQQVQFQKPAKSASQTYNIPNQPPIFHPSNYLLAKIKPHLSIKILHIDSLLGSIEEQAALGTDRARQRGFTTTFRIDIWPMNHSQHSVILCKTTVRYSRAFSLPFLSFVSFCQLDTKKPQAMPRTRGGNSLGLNVEDGTIVPCVLNSVCKRVLDDFKSYTVLNLVKQIDGCPACSQKSRSSLRAPGLWIWNAQDVGVCGPAKVGNLTNFESGR